ncbi:MAG TPA: UDP-N-acetylglucosamine--N-acetylmuramyl-(pentapeptide) pyrophosphoryl-undecaprenol N-acetylglucosamine transferase [Phycisphaerae bacterium]|nr:UDP-N-acetylglucosamine--N-acetylmuramyl-(pentapeptide) pyrophosphoryl-undecaprenol N-acetylglucosamine transferase [Phycisphaerae bacterium]HRR86636.1 UDP-N-acetylglucosamine--N-acetylmuramyl-(pentapeptide) pyrophosphoryl-undecaprenol N-acetylglucosamine transferase [Phycisphaerae bacterium]
MGFHAKGTNVSESRHWFVFAGGGTGGHLFPALAVVELLRERGLPVDVSFFCTQRPIDQNVLDEAQIQAYPLSVLPFPTRPWAWPRFLWHWRQSVSVCRQAFQQRRPAVIVGAGGYASGPPVHVGLKMGIPTFLLNPDAVPGRANRHLGKRPDLAGVFAQWDVTKASFPPTAPVYVTGCPVRKAFRSVCESAAKLNTLEAVRDKMGELKQSFSLDPSRPMLLITGASQGARTINEAFIRLADQIASAGWQVLHLTGQADYERVAREYRRSSLSAAVLPFTDRMAHAMLASDLIVSRAGASTLAEILAVGKPSILLPYPFHRDRHQWHNAEVLVKAGAAILLDDLKDGEENARQIRPVLTDILNNASHRERMGAAACGLGRPQAAAKIAQHLCQSAGIDF